MSLRIYNTLSRALEDFSPLEPGHVRMYVCGMTVYDLCHLGHARSMVAFDVVQRWLRASGLRVTYVRNITDIDDKIIQRAVQNGETIRSLTDRMIAALREDADALGIQRPDHEPRATDYVPEMLGIVQLLRRPEWAQARVLAWAFLVVLATFLVTAGWGSLVYSGSIDTIWPMFGAANQLLGTLALCIATTVLIKMWKSPYLWVTALPMLFVGVITLAGSYEMFWMFLAKAAKLAAGQAFALYLDAVLVAVVAILGIVVLSDSMKQWYGYVILKRPFSSSEVIATAGGGSAGRAQTAIHRQDERTFMLPPGGGCC